MSCRSFCFGFLSPQHFALKKKRPLSQVKLFKPPVVRETISIIQKMVLPMGVAKPFKSKKDVACKTLCEECCPPLIKALLQTAPWELLYAFNHLIDSS